MDRNSEKHDPRIQVILEELRDILDFNAGEAKEDVLDVSTTILQTHFEEASRRHQEDDIGDLLVSCHKLANLSLEDDILDEVTLQSCILDEEWFTHNTENEVTFAPEIQLLENLVNQTYLSAPEEAFCEYLEQELPEIGVLPVEEPIMPGESIFYLTKDPWPKFPSLPAMAQRLPHYDTLPRVVNIVDIAPTLTSLISGPDNTFTVSKSTLEEAGQLMDWLQIDINRLEPKLWMHECWSEKADGLEPMEEPLFPLSHHFVASELAFESDKPSPMVADLLEVIESVEPKTSEQEKRDDEKLFNDLEQCVPTVDVILDAADAPSFMDRDDEDMSQIDEVSDIIKSCKRSLRELADDASETQGQQSFFAPIETPIFAFSQELEYNQKRARWAESVSLQETLRLAVSGMPNTVAADVASSYDSAPTSRQDDEIDQDLQQFFDLQAAAQTPIDVLMETPIDIGSLNKISPPNIPDPTIPVESPDILGQLIGGESALIKPKQVNHLKLQDWNAIGAMQAVMNLEMPPVSDAKLVDSVFFRPPLVTDDMRDEKELSVLSISADIRVKDLARDYLGEPEDPHSENQSVISDLLPPIPEDAHHMNDEDLLPIPENEHCRNDEILDVDTLPDEVEYVSSQLLSDEMKIRNVTGASDEDLQESQPYADLLPRPERKAKSPIEVLEYEAGVQIMQSLDEPPMNSNKRIINPQPFSVQRSLQDFLFHRGQRTVPAQDIGDDDVVAVEQVGQAENASHSSPAPAVQPSFEPPFFDPAVAAKHVYIAGRSLLANRELLRALECDYGVTVVERDLECYRPSISQNGSYREVDLILDERTCVIYYPLSNIALLSPRPVKNVADATKSVEKLSEIDLGNLLLRSVLRYSRIILVLEGVVNPPLPLLSPPVVRAWNALAGFSAILKDVFGVEGVRMELSVSARQSAWIARNAADKIAAMYAEPNVSIHSRPWPSKEAYENRSWLALQETPQERFLLGLPSLNPFTAQIILTLMPLRTFLGMPLQDMLNRFGAWIGEQGVRLLYQHIHTPLDGSSESNEWEKYAVEPGYGHDGY